MSVKCCHPLSLSSVHMELLLLIVYIGKSAFCFLLRIDATRRSLPIYPISFREFFRPNYDVFGFVHIYVCLPTYVNDRASNLDSNSTASMKFMTSA